MAELLRQAQSWEAWDVWEPRETWRLSQACRMPRALTIHWAPCQSWPSEAVRSKVKGKVSHPQGLSRD